MVIGPEDLEVLTQEDEIILKILEEKIDVELKENDIRGSNPTVPTDGIKIRLKVQLKIKQMYIEVGWKNIIFHSEQLGGDWIEFVR